MEEHQQAAERLQARLSGQQSAAAELQEELGEQQQLLQRAQEARRAAAEVSTALQVPLATQRQRRRQAVVEVSSPTGASCTPKAAAAGAGGVQGYGRDEHRQRNSIPYILL